MESRWDDGEANRLAASAAEQGGNADLALRVYTTRLLGSDPKLVLHGGGNTSFKTRGRDLLGAETDVIHIKGSGWNMGTILPEGLPAVRIAPVLTLRARKTVSDTEMARIARACLINPASPDPSVELLLHAFLPHRFIDHTHATAVLSLTNQRDGEAICRELFGKRFGIVPYIMPGFALAKACAEIFEADPHVEGLILLKHGIFTFADTARASYERMIAAVSRAEAHIAGNRKNGADRVFAPAALPKDIARAADIAPVLRGACAIKDTENEGAWRRFILEFRNSAAVLDFVNGEEVARYSQAGVLTPDHTIRTKNWPLIVPAPQAGDIGGFRDSVKRAVAAFAENYRRYFEHNAPRADGALTMLDPMPRVILVPGLGLFGLGRSLADARIAADLAETTVEGITGAEAIGRFESICEADMFDMEYWPLEQAKLGKTQPPLLAGQIVAITGGGGAIGAATAKAFAKAGAVVALLDINVAAAKAHADAIGANARALACDVTDAASVASAFAAIASAFGGVDIVVSNAGAAWQGRIGEVDEAVLRKSFELNFYGHQRVAQAAVRIMTAQDTGGCLLFNVSKQAVNPGPDFGPYGLPKAATFFLMRQYAVDYGDAGIRSNAVNADRIRSGLLTDDFIAQRANARGVTEKNYMSGNLLGREVIADDVAQAFLHQALELKTTGDVTTVDGGNIAAALR